MFVVKFDKEGRPLNRGDAIMAAALKLFAQKTVAATSVEEIAKEAGVAAGTLYRYWPGKLELANALYLRCRKMMADALVVRPQATARAEFSDWWQALARFAADNPEVVDFVELQDHRAYLDAKGKAEAAKLDARAAGFLKRWQKAGQIADIAPERLVALIFGAFLGLWRLTRSRGETAAITKLAAAAEDEVWRLMAPLG